MNILSIQSHVSYGHVGNAAAVFLLQLLGHEVWAVEVPRLHVKANGAGDCLAAILLARILNGHNLPQSISFAVSSIHDILKLTSTTANDLPLVAARDRIVQPTKLFPAVRLDPETYK